MSKERPVHYTDFYQDSDQYNRLLNERCLELAILCFQNGAPNQDRTAHNAIKKAEEFRNFIETHKGSR